MDAETQLRGYATPAAYEDAVMLRVRQVLDLRMPSLLHAGSPLPEPDELAAAMSAGIPDAAAGHPYAAMGPYYSSASVMRLLRIPTKQALSDRRSRGTILAAKTQDGTWVYPAFQFDTTRRRVLPALVPVLAALRPSPRWGACLWLTTPHPDLDGLRPLDAAASDDVADDVAELARQYAESVTSR